MDELFAAESRATAETLIAHGRPLRRIEVEKVDETALGALFMHFMLETVIAAHLLGVDPYDQPAVEEGKRLTRQYLQGDRRP
jgi:glucose-6-phosphate isomerase